MTTRDGELCHFRPFCLSVLPHGMTRLLLEGSSWYFVLFLLKLIYRVQVWLKLVTSSSSILLVWELWKSLKLRTKISSSSHVDAALALTPPLFPSSFLRSIYSFTPSRCRKAAMVIPRYNLSFRSFTSSYFFLYGVLVSFRAMASPLPGFPHRWTLTE